MFLRHFICISIPGMPGTRQKVAAPEEERRIRDKEAVISSERKCLLCLLFMFSVVLRSIMIITAEPLPKIGIIF